MPRFEITIKTKRKHGTGHDYIKDTIVADSLDKARKKARAQYSDSDITQVTPIFEPRLTHKSQVAQRSEPKLRRASAESSDDGFEMEGTGERMSASGCLVLLGLVVAFSVVASVFTWVSGWLSPAPVIAPTVTVAPTPLSAPIPTIDGSELSQNPEQMAVPTNSPVPADTPSKALQETDLPLEKPKQAPPHIPALRTYFTLVRQSDGSETTVRVEAPDETQARTILKDFRGDPKILAGPAIHPTW